MRAGVSGQGRHVGRGRVAGHFAAGGNDVARPGLAMALGDGRRDLFGRAVAERFHRVDVAGQDRLRSHLLPGLCERDHRIDVDHLATQAAHARQNAADVAADVQPHPGAQRVQAVDQPLLIGPDELFVDLRADQRSGGVAHADQVGAGFDLRPAELQPHCQRRIRTGRGRTADRRRSRSSGG